MISKKKLIADEKVAEDPSKWVAFFNSQTKQTEKLFRAQKTGMLIYKFNFRVYDFLIKTNWPSFYLQIRVLIVAA